ncbi:MAG: hypothetical protein E3K37_05520 [Candidatus Kuenenia sp.]|nr:hypothetical protein [Candidatus Kuenenia hertensis]
MPIITIPKILQEKLTEEGAKALVDILDKVEVQGTSHTLEIVEERFEKRLTIEIANVRSDIKDLEGQFNKKLENEITGIRADIKVFEGQFNKKLENEITSIKADMKVLEGHFDKKIDTNIANLRMELKSDIANTKAELIKWMFIFWIGQVATIIGILFIFFKK